MNKFYDNKNISSYLMKLGFLRHFTHICTVLSKFSIPAVNIHILGICQKYIYIVYILDPNLTQTKFKPIQPIKSIKDGKKTTLTECT